MKSCVCVCEIKKVHSSAFPFFCRRWRKGFTNTETFLLFFLPSRCVVKRRFIETSLIYLPTIRVSASIMHFPQRRNAASGRLLSLSLPSPHSRIASKSKQAGGTSSSAFLPDGMNVLVHSTAENNPDAV